jgi:hypothetical protein
MVCALCVEFETETEAATGSQLCERHEGRLWDCLLDIGAMLRYALDPLTLAASHEPPSDMGTRSRPPCSLEIIAVTDRRSRQLTRRDPVSAPRVLGAWAEAVAEAVGGSVSVDPLIYLMGRFGWICDQPAVVRYAKHMAAVRQSLRRATGYA